MKAFQKMLNHYAMDHALFGLGAQREAEPEEPLPPVSLEEPAGLAPSSPLLATTGPVLEATLSWTGESIAIRPTDGTVFDPTTGEVFSESDSILPQQFVFDDGSAPSIEEFDGNAVDYEAEDEDDVLPSSKDCKACPESWICEFVSDPTAPCPLEMPSQFALPMSGFSSPPVFTQPLPAFLTNPAASAANGESCAPSFQGDEEPDSVNV